MSLLGLVPDYGSDSSSSSESDEDESNLDDQRRDPDHGKCANDKLKEPQNTQIPLPLPKLDLKESSTLSTKDLNQRTQQTSSIFFNPYLAAEKQKLCALEKHVQLSETKTEEGNKRNKQVCFKFQKGRCRQGDKCKFSHGTVNVPSANLEKSKEPSITPSHCNAAASYEPVEDEDSWGPQKKKKKKIGVTDTLVPPRRALEAFAKQKLSGKP
ncbi:uncharacterized protein LOC114976326 [Acropora millepora]|uniref:uncharacterized protein LOC114976326 n=1 Tax=Acropora millepora TaxID=45264 RepID=UPI001CF4CC7A|nr:uncharacterized protein LOC114976326 [Acropora millepora]